MTVAPLVDVKGALMARLRSFNEILAFVTTAEGYTADATPVQKTRPRISGRVQSFWQIGRWPAAPTDPQRAWSIVVAGPIGSPGDDRDVDGFVTRFDLHCYGSNPLAAMDLWEQVHPCLCPRRSSRVPERFVVSGCRVYGIDKEGGPNDLIEPDTRYCKTVATYVLRWSEVSP